MKSLGELNEIMYQMIPGTRSEGQLMLASFLSAPPAWITAPQKKTVAAARFTQTWILLPAVVTLDVMCLHLAETLFCYIYKEKDDNVIVFLYRIK